MDFGTPFVDLIMVTYGNAEMCTTNIENIIENTDYPKFTFTIIDNCSLDNTWDEVKKTTYKYPEICNGLQKNINTGYGQGANTGARLTQNPIIVFLNSDVSVKEGHEDWLTQLVDALLESEDIAVAGPKLVNKDNLLMGTGVVGTNKDRKIRGWLEKDTGKYNKEEEVITVCGAVYAVKRDYFMMYGGFFEGYHFYHEEEDFSFKVRNDGLKVVYQPKSVMVHQHMGSCKDTQLLSNYANESYHIFMSRWHHVMDDPTEYPKPLR